MRFEGDTTHHGDHGGYFLHQIASNRGAIERTMPQHRFALGSAAISYEYEDITMLPMAMVEY
jgi:hypothetical protein